MADTVSILRGLRERYELHHGVRIRDSALVEAAVLSDRYISDRFLPDKVGHKDHGLQDTKCAGRIQLVVDSPVGQAIDLVDEAAAKLKMEMTSKPLALDVLDRNVGIFGD